LAGTERPTSWRKVIGHKNDLTDKGFRHLSISL
jgi:hypothetical protein